MKYRLSVTLGVIAVVVLLVLVGWLKEFYGVPTRVTDSLSRKITHLRVQFIQHPSATEWTHRFVGFGPWDLILRTSFLRPQLLSAGVRPAEIDGFENLRRDLQENVLKRLKNQQGSLQYQSLVRGLRDLYGFPGALERRLDIPYLLDAMDNVYNIHYRDWYITSIGHAGIAFSFRSESPVFWLKSMQEIDRGRLPLHLRIFQPILDASYMLQGIAQPDHPGIQVLIEREGSVPGNLDQYLQLVGSIFQEGNRRLDVRAVSLNLSLLPDFHFSPPDRRAAAAAYARGSRATDRERRVFMEYMVYWLVEEAGRRNIAVIGQVDIAGLPFEQRQHYDPVLLRSFFLQREVSRTITVLRYDTQEFMPALMRLLREFPPVHLYMFWVPTCDPVLFEQYFRQALATVPVFKIMYAGGTVNPEQAYGATMIAKEIVTKVLADNVVRGVYTEAEAVRVASRFFLGNAAAAFSFRPGLDLEINPGNTAISNPTSPRNLMNSNE